MNLLRRARRFMCERAGVVRPIRHSGAPGPITGGDDNDDRAGTGAEDATRAIRFTGCTDCAFFGPAARHDARCVDVSAGNYPASAMDGAE